MVSISYQRAKEQLDQVLSGGIFHPQPPAPSLLERLWDWLTGHIHFAFAFGGLKPFAWVLTVLIAAAIVVATAIWGATRWRKRSWKLVESVLRTGEGPGIRQRINLAVSAKDWSAALHMLLALGIKYAQNQGWLRDMPYKTARLCLREIQRTAGNDFADFFSLLVKTTEQVVYAKQHIPEEVILGLRDRLYQWEERVSA